MVTPHQADYSTARIRYPAIDTLQARDWADFFADRPDVLHKLLGDIYSITKNSESTTRRYGKRVKFANGNLDELWAMLSPRYSSEPFGQALRDLMGDQSLRSFAAKIPMHHHSLTRLMRGERQILNPHDPIASMRQLEQIATAGRIHPAYFREWRTLFVTAAIIDALEAKPNLTIGMLSMLADD